MVLDLSQNEDKLRLRVGDYNEPLLLPTRVYTQTLAENNGSVQKSTPIIATYLLAIFAQQTHQKMNYLEVWGRERYESYKDWLLKVVLNPMLNQTSPIPYTGAIADKNQLIKFTEDWNKSFEGYTESQELHLLAESDPL